MHALPPDFVYLRNIDSSIQQEIRYASSHNFIGKPIDGYTAPECILTRQAASALKKVQSELMKSNLSLKVYDCYRPQRAVDQFVKWSQEPHDILMQKEFYPNVDKKDLFKLGYVASPSTHSRGSTVDLTIVSLSAPNNSLDMSTNFDFMDERSHPDNQSISLTAQQNRLMLRGLMEKHGFMPIPTEWWHFTLKNEPYKNTYFDFPITAKAACYA